MFTCPATPAIVTVTLAVSPSAPGCTSAAQTVEITCDSLIPTFTNVYANVISQRCVSCHRPGGGGVNVGMLDMSTQAAAYANLVGVTSAGTGAGTSGVTCMMAALPRVSGRQRRRQPPVQQGEQQADRRRSRPAARRCRRPPLRPR